MRDAIFITGATGFLGMELVARLLEEPEGPDIFIAVRDRSRMDAMLHTLYDEIPASASRLRPVRADLTVAGLGLSPGVRADLCAAVGRVVHCAASVSFKCPLEESRAINVAGTERVLALAAELPGLNRVVHVSTAYVCGHASGTFAETDVGSGRDFRNAYERSKWEAERAVAETRLPVVVVRPSIVVGESVTGWTPAFNALYWPLKAFARGMVRELAANPDGRVDCVPVDYVAEVLHAALFLPGLTGTYHAVAGSDAPTVRDLLELASAALDRQAPVMRDPYGTEETDGGVFAPYLDVGVVFGDRRARDAFGVQCPPIEDYFARLVDHAMRAGWGKRTVTRQSCAATATATR